MKKQMSRMLALIVLIATVCVLASCNVDVEKILQNLPYIGTSTADETTETAPDETTPGDVTTPEGTTPADADPITDPVVTDPVVTNPVETDPVITDPIVTDPIVTDPIVTDPIETDPVVTDPEDVTTPQDPPVVNPPEDDDDDDKIINLGGYVYKAYVRSDYAGGGNPAQDGNPEFYCEDFWVDEANSMKDALSYSVYMRNQAIENLYNIKIQQIHQSGNMMSQLATYHANNDKLDLTIILAKSAAQAATMGLLQDLNSLPYLNLEHQAYDQSSIRELSVGGKLYYLSGDMNISTMDCITPTVVNMELYRKYAESIVEYFNYDVTYADPYNLVAQNKWTISNMLEIAALASVDADPTDGALGSSEWDEIGYFQYATSTLYYFYGMGGRLTEMGDEGVPEFVIQKEKNQIFFDYLFDKMNKSNGNVPFAYGWSGARKTSFIINQNTLFTDMTLFDIRKDLYVNADFEYVILPTPIYEEGDDYKSVVHFSNLAHLWAIPTVNNDLDIAQLMMQTFAATSDVTVNGSTMDAYYTRILYFAAAGNNTSRRSLDIIRNSTVYDIGLLYDWGGWVGELEQLGRVNYNNYGSLVGLMPNYTLVQLKETIEQLQNPDSIIQ